MVLGNVISCVWSASSACVTSLVEATEDDFRWLNRIAKKQGKNQAKATENYLLSTEVKGVKLHFRP